MATASWCGGPRGKPATITVGADTTARFDRRGRGCPHRGLPRPGVHSRTGEAAPTVPRRGHARSMTASEPLTTISLSEPGDLIAATPALLGFVPRSSLVAMALGGASGRRLGLTLRIDLPPPEHVAEAADAVMHGILLDKPSA